MSKYIEAMARMTAKRLDDITLDLVKRLDDLDAKPTITADQVSKTAQEWRTIYRPENNVAIYTNAVLVLNWKIWEWSERGDDAKGRAYNKIWREWDELAFRIWEGDDLAYYIRGLD